MCISRWQYGRFLFMCGDIHVLMDIMLLCSNSEWNIKYSVLCKCKTSAVNSQLALQPVVAEVWSCGVGPFLTQSCLLSDLLFLSDKIKWTVFSLTSNSIRIKNLLPVSLENVLQGSFLTLLHSLEFGCCYEGWWFTDLFNWRKYYVYPDNCVFKTQNRKN